jgi:MFS family permease
MTDIARPPALSPAFPAPLRAWWVVIALMVAYAFSIVDRIGLGLLVQPIEADLHISDSLMGLLQGFAFAIFYGVLGLPLGLLADRTNRRNLVALGVTVWSAATMVCGLASSFPALFLARIGVGAGEATLSPAGASMIADSFPVKERPRAYGIYAIGTSIGSAMAFLLGGAAIAFATHLRIDDPAVFGGLATWKIAFLLIGAPGLVVALIFALTVKEPPRRDLGAARPPVSLGPLWKQLAGAPRVYIGVIAGAVLNTTAIYALVAWFPSLLIRGHGMTAPEVGGLLGTFGVPCGIASCVGSGWVATWLEKRGRADASVLVPLWGVVWFTIMGVVASLIAGAIPAVVFYCLLSLATNCVAVSTLTALNRVTPNALRGQVIALFTLSTGLISLSLGPLAVGSLSDHLFHGPGGLGPALAVVIGVTGVLSFAMFALARAPYRRMAELTASDDLA